MSENTKKPFLNSWWRQFLTSILGTAIGVGLSFVVSNLVDSQKKAKARRQTAIMAVYDIDEIIREIKEEQQQEDALFPIAMYLSNNPDKVETVSEDSLRLAVTYLLEDITSMPDWAIDTKEKAFSGNMEAWQNLENTQFYDNVQKCYQRRAALKRTVDLDVVFQRPISDESLNLFINQATADDLEVDGRLSAPALRRLLEQSLGKSETIRFLRMYLLRSNLYSQYIDELTRLNEENKFLMAITDEEMQEYIRKNVQKTKPATPKLVTGTWEAQMNDGGQTFLFRKDNTLDLTVNTINVANLHVDSENIDVQLKVPITYCFGGTWSLEGDSLRVSCQPEKARILSIDMDINSLPESAREKGEKWVESYKEEFKEMIKSSQMEETYAVSFDLTGNRMFWSFDYTTPTGATENIRQQLIRKKD